MNLPNYRQVLLPKLRFSALYKTLVLAASFFLSIGISFAQPVNAYFEPSEFEAGDEISLIIEYGNIDDPLENINSAHFEIEYNGFEISEEAVPTIDAGGGSWFGTNGNYQGSIRIDHDNHLIIVDLESEEPVSGYGYIARGGGIPITIAEIHAKRNLYITSVNASSGFEKSYMTSLSEIVYVPSANSLEIQAKYHLDLQQVDLMDITGRIISVSQISGDHAELNLSGISSQLLIVRIRTSGGIESRKIFIGN